jgi:hypothetical protein
LKVLKFWWPALGAGIISVISAVFFLFETTSVGFVVVFSYLVFSRIINSNQEKALKNSFFYAHRYWGEEQKDLLEKYAVWWLKPLLAAKIAFAGIFFIGVSLGLAVNWLFEGGWPVAAVFVGLAVFVMREIRRLRPKYFLEQAYLSGDFNTAFIQEAFEEIENLIKEKRPWV